MPSSSPDDEHCTEPVSQQNWGKLQSVNYYSAVELITTVYHTHNTIQNQIHTYHVTMNIINSSVTSSLTWKLLITNLTQLS
jgi:hypothetical protein